MKRNADVITYWLTGIAIAAFATLLVFALLRLFSTEAETRRHEGDNMLWAISRAQTAALLLDAAVSRRVAAPESQAEVMRRYNVLRSRLKLLSEGPQARYMQRLELETPIAEQARAVRAFESDVTGLEYGDVDTAVAIHRVLRPLSQELGRAANRSMVIHWNATGARLDRQRTAILQVIFSILALIVLGTLLSIIMLRAMAQRQNMQRRLMQEQEIGEAYRSFVTLISHQFRTPMAIIDSSMQRILRQGDKASREEITERAQNVRSEVRELTQLMDATLDALRLDSNQINPDPQECSVCALVERVRARQTKATPARQIKVEIAAEVPRRIVTDPLLAEQVLGNLLSNAVKYSPDNELVSLRVLEDEGHVHISIEDRGIGIPEGEQDKLFGRFFRASTASAKPGTGIGLSVAYQLARLLGGTLRFVSRAGVGSTFTLVLPIEWHGSTET